MTYANHGAGERASIVGSIIPLASSAEPVQFV